MAKTKALTWFAPRSCWKKKHRGRVYYLGPRGVRKSDRAAYQSALSEWRELKQDLEQQHAAAAEQTRRRELIDEHQSLYDYVTGIRDDVPPPGAEPISQVELLTARAAVLSRGLGDEPDFAVEPVADPATHTVGAVIDTYLQSFLRLVKAGTRSMGRYEPLRIHLEQVRIWTADGATAPAGDLLPAAINATFIESFHGRLIEQIANDEISPAYARGKFGSLRQFVRWGFEHEYFELPRNLASKRLSIAAPPTPPQHLTVADLTRIHAAATERTRLLVGLMLNTGMTAKDLSDLRHDEINSKGSRITRQRSKTKGTSKNAPTVSYPLWKENRKLLKKYRAKHPTLALQTTKGEPLVRAWVKDDGAVAKVDSVRLAFGRAVRAANRTGTPAIKATVKQLRSTAANAIEQHPDHKGASSLYLAHSPRSIKDRHYVAANQDQLDRAVRWLGQHLGLS